MGPTCGAHVWVQLYANLNDCRVSIGIDNLQAGLKQLGEALKAAGKPDGIVLQHKAVVSTVSDIIPIVNAGDFSSKYG